MIVCVLCVTCLRVSVNLQCCWSRSFSSPDCRRRRIGGGERWGWVWAGPLDWCCDCWSCTGSSLRWQETVHPEPREVWGGQRGGSASCCVLFSIVSLRRLWSALEAHMSACMWRKCNSANPPLLFHWFCKTCWCWPCMYNIRPAVANAWHSLS